MSDVSREEINEIHGRITELDKGFSTCQAEKNVMLKEIEKDSSEMKQDMKDTKETVLLISKKQDAMAVKLSVFIGLIVAVINMIPKLIPLFGVK